MATRKKPRSPRKLTAAAAAKLSRVDYLRHRLREVEGDIAGAREAESWQALAAHHRLGVQIRAEIDGIETRAAQAAEASTVNPLEGMSDDELVSSLVETIGSVPEAALVALEAAIAARRKGRPALKVVPGHE